MSAPRSAFEPTAASASAELATGIAHVRIPGSDRTYEVRDVLRGLGLRWDPISHAWHGTLPIQEGSRLAREFGLRPQKFRAVKACWAPVARAPVAAAPKLRERSKRPVVGVSGNAPTFV